MIRFARSSFYLFALAPLALAGCIASHTPSELDVEASIASVTLADDCGARMDASRDAGAGLWAGDCAEDSPCGFCTQTAVHVSIEAGDGDGAVPFEVIAVRLRAMDGTLLDELDPRDAQIFVEDGYTAWNERIEPGATISVRYETSAPDWTTIGGGNSWATHGMEFRVEMVVRIDGVDRTLELAPASREAEIVT